MIASLREPPGRAPWAQYISHASIGIEMGAALVVGMAIGWFLDRSFETRPWFLVAFTALGIVAGFRNVIRAARKAAADEEHR